MKWLGISLILMLGVLPAEEKLVFRSDVEGAQIFNEKIQQYRALIHEKFRKAEEISHFTQEEDAYKQLLSEIKELKGEIQALEEQWRKTSIQDGAASEEPYAFWDIGETTLSQVVMEYGASDHLYIIPQELSGMKLSLFSSIPLPRESWNEMIEMILAQNGVGVKKLNSFVKQLYILKVDPSAIEGIVSQEEDLQKFSNHVRLFYVFTPAPEMMKSIQAFFERFSDPKQTTVQSIGTKIAIISSKDAIEKLIGLYHAVWEDEKGKVVRLVNLSKVNPTEAEKVLRAVFADPTAKSKPAFYASNADELVTLTLPQGLVLVGEKETVDRAEHILSDLETQLEDPSEKVIFWYACKHSNPEDVAGVLEKIYDSLIGSNFEKKPDAPAPPPAGPPPPLAVLPQEPNPSTVFPDRSTAFNPVLPANPPFVQPGVIDKGPKPTFGNFVVDPKTTSVLMVVRREDLPKIKSILKKLDTPKRMVQLDVLLVEKKTHDRKQVGIDLLRFGTAASHTQVNSMVFDTEEKSFRKGLLSFLFSRKGDHGGPPFDLTYSFLMAQEDIRINANPSVLAVNQTPATVSITEEISINNGAIQLNTSGGVTIEQAYTRAQYGITIVLTPTIHLPEDSEEDTGFISLTTNLEFDTTKMTLNDRPPVTRRHIENQVYVADGETIILGGLRRKMEEEQREKIPFLGDLPGVGKLFGTTKTSDHSTEMFIFITPKIVQNPIDDLRRIRQAEYYKRAGDIPEFLQLLDDAKKKERTSLFNNSLQMLFDMY